MEAKTLSIIVPCYNEEAVMAESYKRLRNVLDALTDFDSEIIFINDGSKDKTAYILTEIAERDLRVKVLHLSRNFGHQPAVTAGIHYCKNDLAIIIDADLQDPPELIPDLIKTRQEEQANVVYCVRKERAGESKFKKISAKLFYRLMNRLSDVKFPLDTGDFRLIDRTVMDEFNKFKEKGKYIRGIISWIGFKQIPYYYQREARFAGDTKYPLKKMLSFATTALLYFSKKPLKIATSMGFIAVLLGVLYGFFVLLGKLFGFIHTISGWTSIIILTVFLGGVQLLSVGVLGQYIAVLFDEVKDRPEYIVLKKDNIE